MRIARCGAETRAFLLATLLAFCFFLPWLPSTVQYGDSGELVGNALALRLSHPPGFPLYHWIYHGFLRLPLPLTPYHQAAALTALLLAAAIGAIVFRLRPPLAAALALLLAAGEVPLRQALLPDVFALHALLAAIVVQAASGSEGTVARWWVFCLALALAAANHPSAVFLAPLGLAFRRGGLPRRHIQLGLLAAALATLGLYASLAFLSRASPFAWPIRPGIAGWWHHLLRGDYGTLRLSAHAAPAGWRENLAHLFRLSHPLWLALLPALALGGRRALRAWRGQAPAWATLALYLGVFYALANVAPEGFGAFVLERFHLLPLVLLGALLAGALGAGPRPRLAAVLLLPLVAYSAYRSLPRNQWPRDTVLEDLALNLRALAGHDGGPCAVILTGDDSLRGALAYLDAAQPGGPAITYVAKGLLTIEAYQDKLAGEGLRVVRRATESGAVFDVERDLLAANLGRCRFYALDGYAGGAAYEVTLLPVGRRLAAGSGTRVSREGLALLRLRSRPPETGEYYSPAKQSFARYAEWPLALGLEAAARGRNEEALEWFRQARALAPYLAPPLANQCAILERLGRDGEACRAELHALRAREYPYL